MDTITKRMKCELVSWEQYNKLARQLTRAIRSAGIEIDMIIAIGRGGYMPARLLSDLLGIMDLTSFKIEHYHGSQKSSQVMIKYRLNADVNQRNILLVDDVSDSGDTFDVAIDHIESLGAPNTLHTAVLHYKSVSKSIPDFYAQEVTAWRWIIYPWAVTEDLAVLITSLEPEQRDVVLIAQALLDKHDIAPSRQQIEDALLLVKK